MTQEVSNIIPGAVLIGQYKRDGRPSVEASVEVTAVLVLPTNRGKVAYVFGTRTDAEQSGRVSLMRLDCFRASTLRIEQAVDFKPIEGYAEGEWYATAGSQSFGWPERVEAKDVEWALESGAKKLNDFEVKYPEPEAPAAA